MNSVIQAACIQAGTALWVARNAGAGSIDVDECVKLAAELYEKATVEKYERSSAGGTQTQRSP